SSRIVPSPPGCGQAFGSYSRTGRTRHPALSSPSRTARTIFDAPGVSPWQQMVCTEISISTPSSVLTLPSLAILTACAAARSGSVIREPASLRETSEPSTLYARSAKPSEATRTPRLRQAASYLPDASVIKISSGPDSSTASPDATAEAHEVRQARVRPDRHAMAERQRDGLAHDVGVAAVEAARDVRRGDPGHDLLVGAERPPAIALAHVAVEIDGLRRHPRGSLAPRHDAGERVDEPVDVLLGHRERAGAEPPLAEEDAFVQQPH